MSTFKKCKVVMLPTNQKATNGCLGIVKKSLSDRKIGDLDFFNSEWFFCKEHYIPVHIYILSNNKIKEEKLRWIVDNRKGMNGFIHQVSAILNSKVCPEIIATTDLNLQIHDKTPIGENKDGLWKCLPQPSQGFIEKYVEQYNKGNIITDVLVEYELTSIPINNKISIAGYIHEYKPKYNTITIKKVKVSWTREELENVLIKHYLDIGSTKGCNLGEDVRIWTKKWIEENL